jgi:hypothetical protein
MIDIDADINGGFIQLIEIEFFCQHFQFDKRATIRIGHTQRNSFWRNAKTCSLDVVMQQLEQDFDNVCVGRLAPKDIFFFIHVFVFSCFETL